MAEVGQAQGKANLQRKLEIGGSQEDTDEDDHDGGTGVATGEEDGEDGGNYDYDYDEDDTHLHPGADQEHGDDNNSADGNTETDDHDADSGTDQETLTSPTSDIHHQDQPKSKPVELKLKREPEEDIKPMVKRALFQCGICDATFVTGMSLKRHNLVFHEDQETFHCPSCQMIFYKEEHLTEHVAEEHTEKKVKVEAQDTDEDGDDEGGEDQADTDEQEDGLPILAKFETHAEDDQDMEDDYESGNEYEAELNETSTDYAHFDNLCDEGDEEDDMNDQPVADPFADDDDQDQSQDMDQDQYEENEDDSYGYDHTELDNSQDGLGANGDSPLNYAQAEFAEMPEEPKEGNSAQFGSQSRSLLRSSYVQQQQPRSTFVKVSASLNGIGDSVAGPKGHLCPECGAGFVTKVNMQRHMLSHGQDRPHKCQLCDKGFVRKEHLFKHLSSVHSGLKFTCEFCGKDISRKDHLLRHIRHVHPSEYLRIPPELLSAQNLESLSHQSLRAAGFVISEKALSSMQPKPKKPFMNCDMCPATFTLLNDLYNHQSEVHSDVRKYKCPVCPKAFKRREHLTKHEGLHSEKKKFLCNKCGRSFPIKDALEEHKRRLHSSDRPAGVRHMTYMEHSCNLCDKIFLNRASLIQHLKLSHRISVNLNGPNQMIVPNPKPVQVAAGSSLITNPMNLGVGRSAPKRKPKPAVGSTVGVGGIEVKQMIYQQQQQMKQFQRNQPHQFVQIQRQPQQRLKTIQPKLNANPKIMSSTAVNSLLQAQQHLNKISGGKCSITISAVPTAGAGPAQVPVRRMQPAQARAPVRIVPAAPAPMRRPAIQPRPNAQAIARQTPTAIYQTTPNPTHPNKIAIKKIGEYMKTTGAAPMETITTITQQNANTQVTQAQPAATTPMVQSFPCSYCNAVYSDEKIFRIHMNSHNANMN